MGPVPITREAIADAAVGGGAPQSPQQRFMVSRQPTSQKPGAWGMGPVRYTVFLG